MESHLLSVAVPPPSLRPWVQWLHELRSGCSLSLRPCLKSRAPRGRIASSSKCYAGSWPRSSRRRLAPDPKRVSFLGRLLERCHAVSTSQRPYPTRTSRGTGGIPRWLLRRQWHKLERSSLFKDAQPYSYKKNDGCREYTKKAL